MLKRINWKGILYGFIWLTSLTGLVLLMSFIEAKKSGVRCRDVKIIIPGTYTFIERSEIDQIILNHEGPLVGQVLDRINIHAIEKTLKANSFIEDAKVYKDMDGVINILIREREPVLRVLNLGNRDFYIDKNGFKIPTSASFTARVLVANGHIAEGFSNKVDTLTTRLGKDLFRVAAFIAKDTLWNRQIEQLFVDDDNEIEMIPRVGNQKIVLGDADSLETKFRNLLLFYKKALPKVGWNTYKTINIKYANQIVCEKADTSDPYQIQSEAAVSTAADSIKIIQDTNKTSTY